MAYILCWIQMWLVDLTSNLEIEILVNSNWLYLIFMVLLISEVIPYLSKQGLLRESGLGFFSIELTDSVDSDLSPKSG